LAGCHAILAGLAGMPGSGLSRGEGMAAAATAVDLLRQAIPAGYRNGLILQNDASFNSLRQRQDFQSLVQELKTRGQAESR